MIQAIKRFWNNQKGVTLIELLAVVVILGVVAAIAAPSVITNFNDAKVNADAQTKAIIEDAAKRMVIDAAKVMPVGDIKLGGTDNETDNLKGAKIEKGTTVVVNLVDYLDANFDKDGKIATAEDKGASFKLKIEAGKVTVTNPNDDNDDE